MLSKRVVGGIRRRPKDEIMDLSGKLRQERSDNVLKLHMLRSNAACAKLSLYLTKRWRGENQVPGDSVLASVFAAPSRSVKDIVCQRSGSLDGNY